MNKCYNIRLIVTTICLVIVLLFFFYHLYLRDLIFNPNIIYEEIETNKNKLIYRTFKFQNHKNLSFDEKLIDSSYLYLYI
jgi:hypothetical protein